MKDKGGKRKCPACGMEYSNKVWLHPNLGICSKCYTIHKYSNHKKWDKDKQCWKKSTPITKWL